MPSSNAVQAPDAPIKKISFETDEGTMMSVDVSPDGRTLVFDLLGDLYVLPMTGGEAVPLTSGRAWDQGPRFSPDGTAIYFVSDRVGYKNLWRVLLSDGSVQQVTHAESDVMGTPNWSHDGLRLLAGLTDTATRVEYILHSINPANGAMTPLERPQGPWIDMNSYELLRDMIRTISGVQSKDGQVYFAERAWDHESGVGTVRTYSLDPETQTRTALTPADAPYSEYKPQISPDGALLSYFRQYDDRRTEIRITKLATGDDRAVYELTDAKYPWYSASDDSRPNYAFTPDGRHIVFSDGGKIRRVRLADGASEIIPFRATVEREAWERVTPRVQSSSDVGEAQVIRWPSISRDGQTVVFAAIGYVWVMDLQSGDLRRLTSGTDFQYLPALSPDDESVAYISFEQLEEGYGPSRLMIVDLEGGRPREALAAKNGVYLLPAWSNDGNKIALIRERDSEDRIQTAFGWTPLTNPAFNEVATPPSVDARSTGRIFARFVGFDETGERLLFSYPASKAVESEADAGTILASAALDGGDLRTLAKAAGDVAGVAPSPDLKRLALTRRDATVWILPFATGGSPKSVTTASPEARRISQGGGYYVNWSAVDQVTFGFGRNVFRYDLLKNRLQSLPVTVTYPRPAARQPIALTGARLITLAGEAGAGRVIEEGTIIVDGRRIIAIGPDGDVTIPEDAIIVDASGKTIMPGLIDTHYHRIGGGVGRRRMSAFKLPNPTFGDKTALAYGVTTAWEPGGVWDDGVPATADLQAAGRIPGPRWSHSAMGSVGYPYDYLTSFEDALAAVTRQKALGADVLKEYEVPTRRQRQWLSTAAREAGLGMVSHIGSFDDTMTLILDGYTGGDHPYIPARPYKDVYELLAQTGYIWTPNVVITPGTVGVRSDKKRYYWREVLERRPNELDKLEAITGERPDVSEPSVPYELHRAARVARAAADAAKHGARIGVSAHNMPGVGVHREMWFLWKGGMPIADVLRAATMTNAEKLGLQEEVGSLEIGKIADFLVLDENPLDDIINTLSIEYTVQGGVVYDADTAERLIPSQWPPCETGKVGREVCLAVVN